jgi:hypothetical protein
MNPDLRRLLLYRLQHQGVNPGEVPALLRDLSNILESDAIDTSAINSKLHRLGWTGVTLDYQSLQLALAWMESENAG